MLILLISGGALSIAGAILHFFPPKKINYWYGYRTSASMRSQERWDFAQKYSARGLVLLGLALMAVSLIDKLFNISLALEIFIALGLLIAGVIGVILRVEKALKERFGNL